jgi:hypothetical protein
MTMGGRSRIRTSIRSAIACIGAFIERWCPVTNGIRSGFRSTFEKTTALTSLPGHDREDYDDTIDSTRGSPLSGWDPSQSNTTGTDCASKALHFTAVRRKRWATCTSVGDEMAAPFAVSPEEANDALSAKRKYVRKSSHCRDRRHFS